jgi:hypothetical protein
MRDLPRFAGLRSGNMLRKSRPGLIREVFAAVVFVAVAYVVVFAVMIP